MLGPVSRPWPTAGLLPVFLVALLATVLSSCASRNEAPSPFDGSAAAQARGADEPIRVEVQNLNFNDVTVWAIRQGQRIRLGRVTGKTDQTFRTDWNPAMPISFMIDVTGGRTCNTEQVGVDRNAVIWVSVPSNVGAQACRAGRR
jgi:hypothetical protein